MWQRDITEAEVREALAQPKNRHSFNSEHATMNVRYTFPNMSMPLLVAYDEREDEVHIVTVIDEDED